jgi:predicted enzyme related to lactoylglutathione lyase
MPPMVVSEQGNMALIADPSGAAVGLWQFAEHTGFQVHLEPGTPYWHELQATNYEETVRFYQDVLGWETSVMSDSPDFRYTTLGAGRASKAGIMDATSFLTEDYRPAWHLYLGVEDADAAIATARDMGASVLDPAADTPFGRIATLADPTGARFKIAQGTPQG